MSRKRIFLYAIIGTASVAAALVVARRIETPMAMPVAAPIASPSRFDGPVMLLSGDEDTRAGVDLPPHAVKRQFNGHTYYIVPLTTQISAGPSDLAQTGSVAR